MVNEDKLPFGLPPVLPDVKEQLKTYLLQPEKLPIHDYQRSQLFWPRQPEVTDLFNFENSPLATTLKFQRDPFTGQIIDFHEVQIDDVGLTNKNSTSLSRAPNRPSEATRGSSSNYPFWPGGFPDPVLNLPTDESEIDLCNDLLSIPPGFSRGLQFREDGCTLVTDSPPVESAPPTEIKEESSEISVVNLLSVVQKEQDLLGFWSETKPDEKSVPNTVQFENFNIEDKDVIPIEDSIPVLKITESKSSSVVRQSQWAEMIDVNKPCTDFEKKLPKLAYTFPFTLDTFQKQAILKIEEHSNVFVAAHTSAGKTVVAEYAIALSQLHSTRVIYTSPIKALSNQKYNDFKRAFKDVGLITGDFQINENASCLIMTTEILRSMLYNGSDVTRDLEYVIFDEVHYINDADRGHVWEEVLILLPDHVTIIMLSATVPNTLEFADWVGCTKQRKVYVISTPKRPVPLMHYLYTGCGGRTKHDRFLIVNSEGKFIKEGYDSAVQSKASRGKKDFNGPKGGRQILSPNQEQTLWIGLVDHLRTNDKLPVVAFTLSRKRCDTNAEALSSLDLNTNVEKSEIHRFFTKCIKRLKEPDQQLPQVKNMQRFLELGIAVHHSGILPILKEIVEMLFQRGLVKILFATETFAMGVNMATKAVLFDAIRKFDGKQARDLLPAEYIQMAGRAGRRGKDTEGTVIIICKGDVPDMEHLKQMMLGKPEKLQSQFRLTYGMLLNLLRVESLTVERVLSHSFREVGHRTRATLFAEELKRTEKELSSLPKTIAEHLQKLTLYYDAVSEYLQFRKTFWSSMLQKWAGKDLVPGRVLLITCKNHVNKFALILAVQNKKGSSVTNYTALVLNHQKGLSSSSSDEDINLTVANESDNNSKPVKEEEINEDYYRMLAFASNEVFQPDGVGGHEVITITMDDIFEITTKVLKMDTLLVIKDWEKRQIQRFRFDPPGKTCNDAIQELTKLTHEYKTKEALKSKVYDIQHDYKIKDIEYVMKLDRLNQLYMRIEKLIEYTKIANFEKQFNDIFKKKHLEDRRKDLEFFISNQSMSLYPEFESRIAVLTQLDYIDSERRVKLKGRVACGIGTNELILTELVLRNVLTNLKAEEVAALLSCLVFQAKTNVEPNLTNSLKEGRLQIEKIDAEIKYLEKQHAVGGSDTVLLATQEDLNFGLVEVVYEWAQKKEFAAIMALTDIQEGIIVRCIQQLNEILGNVRDAAIIIGDPKLVTKMEEASTCIKRDIVFTASLYTQDENV